MRACTPSQRISLSSEVIRFRACLGVGLGSGSGLGLRVRVRARDVVRFKRLPQLEAQQGVRREVGQAHELAHHHLGEVRVRVRVKGEGWGEG